MMPAMNMPQMPQSSMMSGMPGMGMPMMMPMMPNMMGMMPNMMGMMPNMMMPGMMPNMMMPMMPGMMPSMGMMPMMGMMPGPGAMPMMCRMTMEMGKDGMTCKLMPMEGMTMDMMRERCESMMKMMSAGMPMTMMCGGQVITCVMGK